MAEDGGPPPKRAKIHRDEIDKLSRDELVQKLFDQEAYIDSIQQNKTEGDSGGGGGDVVGDVDEKLKQQQVDATRRENVLVMRLTTKEQDLQEYLNQIQELKQVKNAGTMQLRSMLLDPAINLMFQRMRREMDSCKEKLEQAQNDLAAWKFTPDSQTGKRLMAKCRMLLQENEELGKMISAGRTAKLEGEIALEKKFVEEMKKSQAETDEFLVEMDEDTEGLQSTIFFLQQQLKELKEEVIRLRDENDSLRTTHQQQTPRDRDSEMEEGDSNVLTNNTQVPPRTVPVPVLIKAAATPLDNGSRTGSDDNVVSSSSPDGTKVEDETEPHSTQDSRQSPPTNGQHLPMETDLPESSSEHRQAGSGSQPGSPPSPAEATSPHLKNHRTISPTTECRTDASKTITDRIQNGMISKQYSLPESDSAN